MAPEPSKALITYRPTVAPVRSSAIRASDVSPGESISNKRGKGVSQRRSLHCIGKAAEKRWSADLQVGTCRAKARCYNAPACGEIWIIGSSAFFRSLLGRLDLGSVFQSQLVGGDSAHLEFLDLAGDCHRKGIDESDVAGYLELRDPAPAEVLDIILGQLRSLLQLDPGNNLFPILTIGHADHLHIADARTGV